MHSVLIFIGKVIRKYKTVAEEVIGYKSLRLFFGDFLLSSGLKNIII